MNLFITGATGYIGHRLALDAAQNGHKVHALVRDPNAATRPLHENIRFFRGDITDAAAVSDAMKGCEQVIHAAALARLWTPQRNDFYRINVGGTQNVLEAAYRQEVQKMVFTSTCGVLGPANGRPVKEDDPRIIGFENDYEISKHCAEQLAAEYAAMGLPVVTVALPRVYGPGPATEANPITKVIKQALNRGYAVMPSAPDAIGSYTYIDDVVRGHMLALEKGTPGEKYILAGVNANYAQFFGTVREVSGRNIRFIPLPRAVLVPFGALAYGSFRLIGKHTHITPKTVVRLFRNCAMSSEKAIRELGYTITPLQTGISQTIQFLKTGSYA